MPVTIEKTEWGGWPGCYRMSNGEVELVITSDVGPRVMRYGFVGGQNLFLEIESQKGRGGEKDFQGRGGHRIWTAPERFPRTYAPDNRPVEIEAQGSTLVATAPVEPETGLRKKILLRLASAGTAVSLVHTIENTLAWPIEVAPWALTMMAPGGVGMAGFPPRGTHPEMLAPTNPLVMWAFSDLSDPRWQFTQKHLILRHDAARSSPTKLGLFSEKTWGAYLLQGELFVKRYEAEAGKPYPDMGASFEMFANGDTLELETLGPLTSLDTGESVDHAERWTLHRGVALSQWSDQELDRVVGALL